MVTNALRLNLFQLYDARKDKKHAAKHSKTTIESQKESSENDTDGSETAPENKKEKETKTMEKTMEIKGMMCGHCEARVKKTLEAIAGVEEAAVSHEKGTAVVKLSAEVADDVLKQAVEAQDYEVTAIH